MRVTKKDLERWLDQAYTDQHEPIVLVRSRREEMRLRDQVGFIPTYRYARKIPRLTEIGTVDGKRYVRLVRGQWTI